VGDKHGGVALRPPRWDRLAAQGTLNAVGCEAGFDGRVQAWTNERRKLNFAVGAALGQQQ